MNRNLDLRSRGHSPIGKLSSFAIVIVVTGSIIGCNPFSSSGTGSPQVTIQNVNASRDQVTGLPVVTIDYTVKYPSDLYAQTLVSVPTLTCTMEQKQLTRNRTFTGAPVNITGTTSALQRGQASILVPEDGKFIAGSFSVYCTLASDRTLGTSNTSSVEVPKHPDAEAYAGAFAGTWDTNWGEMTCTVNGITVHCEYTHDQGKIDATLSADGRTMEGQWAESPSYSPPNDGGRVTFTLSEDGNAISGDWSYGQGSSEGSWTGTRK